MMDELQDMTRTSNGKNDLIGLISGFRKGGVINEIECNR